MASPKASPQPSPPPLRASPPPSPLLQQLQQRLSAAGDAAAAEGGAAADDGSHGFTFTIGASPPPQHRSPDMFTGAPLTGGGGGGGNTQHSPMGGIGGRVGSFGSADDGAAAFTLCPGDAPRHSLPPLPGPTSTQRKALRATPGGGGGSPSGWLPMSPQNTPLAPSPTATTGLGPPGATLRGDAQPGGGGGAAPAAPCDGALLLLSPLSPGWVPPADRESNKDAAAAMDTALRGALLAANTPTDDDVVPPLGTQNGAHATPPPPGAATPRCSSLKGVPTCLPPQPASLVGAKPRASIGARRSSIHAAQHQQPMTAAAACAALGLEWGEHTAAGREGAAGASLGSGYASPPPLVDTLLDASLRALHLRAAQSEAEAARAVGADAGARAAALEAAFVSALPPLVARLAAAAADPHAMARLRDEAAATAQKCKAAGAAAVAAARAPSQAALAAALTAEAASLDERIAEVRGAEATLRGAEAMLAEMGAACAAAEAEAARRAARAAATSAALADAAAYNSRAAAAAKERRGVEASLAEVNARIAALAARAPTRLPAPPRPAPAPPPPAVAEASSSLREALDHEALCVSVFGARAVECTPSRVALAVGTGLFAVDGWWPKDGDATADAAIRFVTAALPHGAHSGRPKSWADAGELGRFALQLAQPTSVSSAASMKAAVCPAVLRCLRSERAVLALELLPFAHPRVSRISVGTPAQAASRGVEGALCCVDVTFTFLIPTQGPRQVALSLAFVSPRPLGAAGFAHAPVVAKVEYTMDGANPMRPVEETRRRVADAANHAAGDWGAAIRGICRAVDAVICHNVEGAAA